jgi:crotonobetainyl-CoA:carnitine CoA-transferase CaiB-like acyl-CoA transferase
VYLMQDDRHVAIAGSTQALTERLFREMGREDLTTDPRFKSNRDRLDIVDVSV